MITAGQLIHMWPTAVALLFLFVPTASAVPILVETMGSVEVTRLYWSSGSGCGTQPCGPTGLENGPQPLAVSLSMLVDSSTGAISSGAISVVAGQSIIIGNTQNNTWQEIVFNALDMSFAGNINGVVSGFFDGGSLTFIVRSRAHDGDSGGYLAAAGPAVIPVTGNSSLNGTQLALDLSSENFFHRRTASAATIDVALGAFSFAIEPVPEPNTALLLSLGLVGLSARRRSLRS